MANPQSENGHVDLANEIIEALARYRLSGEEWQCLLVVFRKTYGWKKKEDEIPLSQFAKDTGMKRPHVVRAIKKLLSKKVLYVTNKGNIFANKYMFNKDFDSWLPITKKDTTPGTNKGNGALPKKVHSKDTSSKDNKKDLSVFFEGLWKAYPRKDGKKTAFRHYLASVKTQEDMDQINLAMGNYLNHIEANSTDPKFIKNGSTWFNNWQDWEVTDEQ